MKQPISAIAVGALAVGVIGFAALAHYSSTARASQPAAAAIPASSTYLAPVAPAAAPVTPVAVPGSAQAYALVPVVNAPGVGAPGVAAPGVAAPVVATPVATRVVTRDRVVYRTARPRYYVHRRSKKHSIEIIGGSTLGGAGIGALVGGKKGALIGGLVGGAAGTVYDRKTHKKVVRE
jgi:hypothetical protein